jgi:hypothetical protein
MSERSSESWIPGWQRSDSDSRDSDLLVRQSLDSETWGTDLSGSGY